MRALIGVTQYLHLSLIQHIFLRRDLTVCQSFVDLITGVNNGLHIFIELVLLVVLGDLELRRQFALREDRLYQRSGSLHKQCPRISNQTSVVSPTDQARERERRVELRLSGSGVIERLSQSLVGGFDIRTVLQESSRYTGTETLRQFVRTPRTTSDLLRRLTKQFAKLALCR